jgi:preprotein translocase subunit SecY
VHRPPLQTPGLFLIVVFRFGSALPAPGISAPDVRYCAGLESSRGGAASLYAVLNVFSGNSLLHVTVFALGIMPYITASIIVQLLTQVIPRLQALKDQDRAGQATITQYTRYLTMGLAVIISAGYVELARTGNLFPGTDCSAASRPLIPDPSVLTIATMMITMVAGTAVIMWMGELITDRGIGNGMSVMIFTSVIAVFVSELQQIYLTRGIPMTLTVIAVVVAVIGFVVFIEQGQRRIPVQYARRMTGRRVYGGAVYLAVIALLPMVALGLTGIGSQALYSGVSLLIMVGVGLDTVKQIESQLRQHRYEGFLRRPVRPAGKVHGTSDAPAALTLS